MNETSNQDIKKLTKNLKLNTPMRSKLPVIDILQIYNQ